MKKTFIIISSDKYPEGDAGAVREHAFALILKELGYTPIVIGMGPSTNFKSSEYDGIQYFSLRYKKQDYFHRALGFLRFTSNLKRILKSFNPHDINGIMYVSSPISSIKHITNFAKKHSIELYHDSVEWYSPEQFDNGEKSKILKNKNKLNTELINKNWNVIAISTFLEEHFKKQCKKVVRIPVIMDIKNIEHRISRDANDKIIKFVYAGAPGKKDYLKNIIDGFALLTNDQIKNIQIDIAGITREQLLTLCDADPISVKKLSGSLILHGRIPRNEAVRLVKNADFTLLIRDETLRYAKAGFPTKIVESLACGTPPICNYSSDLSLYLKDSFNAFIIEGHYAKDVKNAVERIFSFDIEQFSTLRRNARQTAEKEFNYKNYIDQFDALLREDSVENDIKIN